MSSPGRECANYMNGHQCLCSLTDSNHVFILAVSPSHFSRPQKTVFDFDTILSSETIIIPNDPPILAQSYTTVSVCLRQQ